MTGIINIIKPKNISSSNVVVKVKKLLKAKKVGHMGTLDPLAQGVLPICVGRATRLFDYFLKKQKTYIATFEFGYETDTLDLEGDIFEKSTIIPKKQGIEDCLKKEFLGRIFQLPPKYSAKKVGGKTACDITRHGGEVKLKPCEVEIFEFKIIRQNSKTSFDFEIVCSAGTYIRALARDLGRKLNSRATMTNLIRTKSGAFEIEKGVKLDDLTTDNISNFVEPIEKFLSEYKKIDLTSENFKTLLDGKKLFVDDLKKDNIDNDEFAKTKLKDNEIYSFFCKDALIGLGIIEDNRIVIKTYLFE